MVKEDSVKEKWYKSYGGSYMRATSKSNYLFGNEYICRGRYTKGSFSWDKNEPILLTDLSEITSFLPKGHPDLEQNILQSLEIW